MLLSHSNVYSYVAMTFRRNWFTSELNLKKAIVSHGQSNVIDFLLIPYQSLLKINGKKWRSKLKIERERDTFATSRYIRGIYLFATELPGVWCQRRSQTFRQRPEFPVDWSFWKWWEWRKYSLALNSVSYSTALHSIVSFIQQIAMLGHSIESC